MAISPPSDIVMDVARAADPAQIREARAALASRAGGSSATFSIEGPALPGEAVGRTAPSGGGETVKAGQFQRFEAMVLKTFIQNMLPKDAEGIYGKGLAGDMWKSQMAEQLADVMAGRGGIGIAKRMLADHYMEGKRAVPVGPVSGGPDKAETDRQTSLSTSLVQEIERRMARSLGDDTQPVETGIKV